MGGGTVGAVEPSRRSSPLAVAGSVLGVLAVAIVASVPRSPFQPVLPPGVAPGGPFAWLARVLELDRIRGTALVFAGLVAVVLALGSFLWILQEAWRGRVRLSAVIGLAVAYHVVVLLLPLLFSRDVYSYAFYGRIASVYHMNPYVRTPADFPRDALASLVGPKWIDTPAVYGPLFTGVSALVTRAVSSAEGAVVAFRTIAVTASLGTVAILAAFTRRAWPSRAPFAVAAFGLNPVVLFQSAASGHNDLLVACAVAGSLALVASKRNLLAVAVLALGTLVKATTALPLLLLIVWCIARAPAGRRARTLASHAGLAAAVGVVFAAPFFQLRDPTLGLAELAGHEGWLAPSRLFRRLLDTLSGGTLGIVARMGFAALLIASVVLLVRTVWRRALIDRSWFELGSAWGWSLLLLMLLGPVLLPWYVTWALPLVWLLPQTPRTVLIGVSAALTLSQWTSEPARFATAYDANVIVGHYVITPIVIGLLVWLILDGRRRAASRLPLGEEPDVAAAPAEH